MSYKKYFYDVNIIITSYFICNTDVLIIEILRLIHQYLLQGRIPQKIGHQRNYILMYYVYYKYMYCYIKMAICNDLHSLYRN